MTGKVKSFSKSKGYGFITDGVNDYRFKIQQWESILPPVEGLTVKFKPYQTDKGLRATNIRGKEK